MIETTLSIEDAARCLPDLVDRLYTSGEAALLTRSGRPVARIVPVANGASKNDALVAFLRAWREEHPEPDEQFGDAIAESRRVIQAPRDPWE
jgi:antitoxin (DNA-binding transcriptional repressor) of toxin-antitoxin stability system